MDWPMQSMGGFVALSNYSLFNASTGLADAVRQLRTVTVTTVMSSTTSSAKANTHQCRGVR